MNTEQYRDSLKGFNADPKGGENTFETWKKFVLGQAGRGDSSLPFTYKDSAHTQTTGAPGSRNGWLEFPTWASSSLGFGGNDSSSSSWWETLGLTRMQRYIAFGVCIAASTLLFMMSMMYLPLAVIRPAKFAAPYCLASLLVFGSFGFLQGFITYGRHLVSRDRLPFTMLFFGTTTMTLYSATHSLGYILTVVSVLAQLVCLVMYVISYVPGGQSGITFMSSMVGSSLRSQFSGN